MSGDRFAGAAVIITGRRHRRKAGLAAQLRPGSAQQFGDRLSQTLSIEAEKLPSLGQGRLGQDGTVVPGRSQMAKAHRQVPLRGQESTQPHEAATARLPAGHSRSAVAMTCR